MLNIDIEKQLSGFRLAVKLAIGAEILVLFGPSGAGKTQTLNALAGLLTPDRGEITLDGRCFFRRGLSGPEVNVPARRRHVAMVFQQYALFPHLTAQQNVEYPLHRERDAGSRARALLRRMQLEALGDRYPHELSGGQQQRVAIARALAADARVLLLDEPFSALDRPIREQLHQDLMTLQEETGLVVVYVTHNLDDALTAGHRMAILNHGRIEQVAGLPEIFTRPRSRAVLEILGVPNIFQARWVDGLLDWEGIRLTSRGLDGPVSGDVCGYIPAEDVRIVDKCSPAINAVSGKVLRSQPAGLFVRLFVEIENGRTLETSIRLDDLAKDLYAPGSAIRLSLPPDRLVLVRE